MTRLAAQPTAHPLHERLPFRYESQPRRLSGSREVIAAVERHLKNPKRKTHVWTARVLWEEGTRFRGKAGKAKVFTDLPRWLGGENSAPSAYELALAALGAAVGCTFLLRATLRGLHLLYLEVETEGAVNVAALLGRDAEGPGLENLWLRIKVKADPTKAEALREIYQGVMQTCSVLLAGGQHVKTQLVLV